MGTWVNNAVHVQVKIIHLLTVGVGARSIDWNLLSIDFLGQFLNNRRDNLRVLVGKPSEESGDTHIDYATSACLSGLVEIGATLLNASDSDLGNTLRAVSACELPETLR